MLLEYKVGVAASLQWCTMSQFSYGDCYGILPSLNQTQIPGFEGTLHCSWIRNCLESFWIHLAGVNICRIYI
jgi:hypothetical protein